MNSKTELPIRIASGLWLACFVASSVMFAITPPTGESFFRGLNRVIILLGWQLAAFLVAVTGGILTFRRKDRISRGLRWIGFTPLIVSGLCVAGVAILVIFARF
ncbi:MAG TPA: hypothetical protein VML01_01170 [Bryobacterales bacterium]|nr:hypothetical protein [Bryobacterales bacterium]